MKATARRATALAVAAILMTAPVLTPATAAPSVPVPGAVSIAAAVSKAKITTQPKSATVASGKTHTFSVKASGSKLKYQWYVKKPNSSKWVKASGDSAKTRSLKVKASTKLNGTQYRVVASNSRTKSTSKSAKLTVVTKPKFTTQPKNLSVAAQSKVTVTAKASGGSLSYRWQRKSGSKWSDIPKATKPVYKFTASSGKSTTEYRVRASNKAGTRYSTTSTVRVLTEPSVKTPQQFVVRTGESVTIKSQATGGALGYQWERWTYDESGSGKWMEIPGATKSSYAFAARSRNDLDAYRVQVSYKIGVAVSGETYIYVDSSKADPMLVGQDFALPGWILNLSAPEKFISDTEAGVLDLYADLTILNVNDEPAKPGDWLTVDYIGNDGVTYNGDDYVVEGSYLDMGVLKPDGSGAPDEAWGIGLVFADVPKGAVSGGVWRITEEVEGTIQYVKGF